MKGAVKLQEGMNWKSRTKENERDRETKGARARSMIVVRDTDDIEHILQIFKRTSQPLLKELKHKTFFETKSERRKRKDRAAEIRRRKKERRHEASY